MTWFRVDDGFWSNPKVLTLSEGATSLWVRAGSYASQHLTDGRIDAAVLRLLGSVESADELVAAGLWRKVKDGYKFHDWDDYQETSEAVKKRRDQARDRQRRAREARDAKRAESHPESRDSHGDVTRDTTREFSTPDPTRPDLYKRTPSTPPASKARYTDEFEAWWKIYPRKVAKGAAAKAFAKIDLPSEQLIEITRRFADRVDGTEPRFIPHPATWLNERRFDDDDLAPGPSPEEMVREMWRTGSVGRLRELTGMVPEDIRWPDPEPEGFDSAAHRLAQRRTWIESNREEIVRRLKAAM